jgi:hypothetical protein
VSVKFSNESNKKKPPDNRNGKTFFSPTRTIFGKDLLGSGGFLTAPSPSWKKLAQRLDECELLHRLDNRELKQL